MKNVAWTIVLALLVAGCGQRADAETEVLRIAPKLERPRVGLPPIDEAQRVASARDWRERECARVGDQTWPELPGGRRRSGLELTAAAARGDLAAVESLLGKGADPGFATPDFMGPLALAAECDRAAVVRRLLKAGAPLEGRYEWSVSNLVYRQTALMIAAQHGSEGAVEVLLAAGADPNLEQFGRQAGDRDFEPWGATLVLAETNAIARRLLEAGADPNAGIVTPLMSAAETPDPDRIRLMLQHGADPDRRDAEGLRAIDHARRSRANSTEVAQVLEAAMAARP